MTDYNLDELDATLSSAAYPAATSFPSEFRRGSVRVSSGIRNGSITTAPGTRRGSLTPGADGRRPHRLNELNLFHFDLTELVKNILLAEGESRVSYHEYAMFSAPEGHEDAEDRTPSVMADGQAGLKMFRDALIRGHGLDDEGNFTPEPKGTARLQGRVRQVIAHRRAQPGLDDAAGNPDGLFLTVDDYESLGLHAGTLPSTERITVESMFWNHQKDTLYLVLSFSNNPQPPYDFLSMAYKLRMRTTNALIRRSFNTRWHDEEALDEYERRLDSCRGRWAHPLVLPVVLLQVQLMRTEEEVVANNNEVLDLETRVDDLTGDTGRAAEERRKKARKAHRSRRKLSTLRDFVGEKVGRRNSTTDIRPSLQATTDINGDYVPPQTIHLMKEAHDVLKGSIQLLDTLRWMERAVKLIIQAGDELEVRLRQMGRSESTKADTDADEGFDDLSSHWHEIRQYLDCTWRLCTSLETDRRMSELRCRAQIDIIYSKMAQEDNNLNARMAVASTRDGSSMKALAVITAIFLPGEYIGTLFGMAMFNWEMGTAGDSAISEDAPDGWPHPVIMPLFWVYWAFTLPLTIFIVSSWRAWWVNQDRYFRRHLSLELSNERYWTADGKPRELDTSFVSDFFSLFRGNGSGSTANSTIVGSAAAARKAALDVEPQSTGFLRRGTVVSGSTPGKDTDGTDGEDGEVTRRKNNRVRTISFARQINDRVTRSAV